MTSRLFSVQAHFCLGTCTLHKSCNLNLLPCSLQSAKPICEFHQVFIRTYIIGSGQVSAPTPPVSAFPALYTDHLVLSYDISGHFVSELGDNILQLMLWTHLRATQRKPSLTPNKRDWKPKHFPLEPNLGVVTEEKAHSIPHCDFHPFTTPASYTSGSVNGCMHEF